MAKDNNTVEIQRGKQKKNISKSQWESMKKSGSTYGWHLSSELPKEVVDKDTEIENSQVKELEGKLADANETIKEKDGIIAEKDEAIKELEGKLADALKSPEEKLLELYADEVNAKVSDLREYAKENDINIHGLKKTEDIQLAIAKWLDENKPKKESNG